MPTFFKDMSDDALLLFYKKLSPKELLKQTATGDVKLHRLALIALFRQSSDEAMFYHRQLLSQWIIEPDQLMPSDRDIELAITLPNATCMAEGLMVIKNRKRSPKQAISSSSPSSPTAIDKTYCDITIKRLASAESNERMTALKYLMNHSDFVSLNQSQASILPQIVRMLFNPHKKEQKLAFTALTNLIPKLSMNQYQETLFTLFGRYKREHKTVFRVAKILIAHLNTQQHRFILKQVLKMNVDYISAKEFIDALAPNFHTPERIIILNHLLSMLKYMDGRYFPRNLSQAVPMGFDNDLKQVAYFISLLGGSEITTLLNELSTNNEEMSSIRPHVIAFIKKRRYLLPILNEVLALASSKSSKIDEWPLNCLNKLVPYFTEEEQNTIILPYVLSLLSESESSVLNLLNVLTKLDLNFVTTQDLYEVVQKVLEKNEYSADLQRPMKVLLQKLTQEQVQSVLDHAYRNVSMHQGNIENIRVSLMVLNTLDTDKYTNLLNQVLLMLNNDSLFLARRDLLRICPKLASKIESVEFLLTTIESVTLMANSRNNASYVVEITDLLESLALRACDLVIEEKERLPSLFSNLLSVKHMISPMTYKSLIYLLEDNAVNYPDTYSNIIQHIGQLINTQREASKPVLNLMNMWLIQLVQMNISPEMKHKLLQPIIELSQQLNSEHEKTPQTELFMTNMQIYLDTYFDLQPHQYPKNSVAKATLTI